jgi:hypothetical protein
MFKEIGDKMNVLINLLPRIVDPADARHLLNITFSGSVKEKIKIKKSFRDYYYVAMNVPNGHYSLLVGEKVDRSCLDRLITMAENYAAERSALNLGDTSQHGNWQGFRNAVFEGKPIVLDKEWLSKMPLQGKLEFDFVATGNITSAPISNKRFFQLIKDLGLVEENHWTTVERKLQVLNNESDAVLLKGKRSKRIMTPDSCSEMMKHLQSLYQSVASRSIDIDMRDIEKEEASLLDPKLPKITPPKTPDVLAEATTSEKKEKKSSCNVETLTMERSLRKNHQETVER